MPLGPVSLVLLVATAAALPLLLRAFPPGPDRRLAGSLLGAMLLTWAGLYVLYWSRTACWLLVAGACALAGAGAFPPGRTRRWAMLGLATPAVVLGAAFDFLVPGDAGIVMYVAGAVPLLVVAALALPLAAWLRWTGDRRMLGAGAALMLLGGLVPFTSFYPTFLQTFEPAHLPLLLLATAGLAWTARRGLAQVAHARTAALASEDVGTFAARPQAHGPRWPALATVAAALAVALGSLLVASAGHPPEPPGLVGLAMVLLAGASALVVAHRAARRGQPLASEAVPTLVAVAGAGVAASDVVDVLHGLQGPVPAVAPWALLLPSLGAALAGVGLLLVLARLLDGATRTRAAEAMEGTVRPRHDLAAEGALPAGAVQESMAAGALDVAALQAFAARLRGRGAPVGLLVVEAPAGEALWSLPDDAYAWLLDEGARGPRVHVAVVEGAEASLVPPMLSGEGWD